MKTSIQLYKNTLFLYLNQIVSILASFVFIYFFARYLGPKGIGQYNFAFSIVALVIILVNFGFQNLIVRDIAQEKKRTLPYFLNISLAKFLLSLFGWIIIYAILYFSHFGKEINLLIVVVYASNVISSLTETASSIFVANEKIKYDVLGGIVSSISSTILGVVGIFLHLSIVGIILLFSINKILQMIYVLYILFSRFIKEKIHFQFNLKIAKNLAIKSIPFIVIAIFGEIYAQENTIILKFFKGDEVVGWYAAGNGVVNRLVIIPGMLGIALYPVFSRFWSISKEKLSLTYQKLYKLLLVTLLPIAIFIFLIADKLILLIYGPDFSKAVIALKILIFTLVLRGIGTLNGIAMNAFGRQALFAKIVTVTVIFVVILDLIFVPYYSYIGICATTVFGIFVGFIAYSIICHKVLKLNYPWLMMIKIILIILISMGIFYFLFSSINSVIRAILSILVYIYLIFLLKILTFQEAKKILYIISFKKIGLFAK